MQEAENINIEKNEVVFETPDDESVNDSKCDDKVACYFFISLVVKFYIQLKLTCFISFVGSQ